MMKRFLSALIAVAALLTGALASAAPASAYAPHPADINGYRFWTGSICVDGSAINGPYYRVAYIAQQWNLRVGNTSVLALDYEDDCAAAGYPPSRRMVIGSFSNGNQQGCFLATNQGSSPYNGMNRWTQGPGIYINFAETGCINSQVRRDHTVSIAIGTALGLRIMNSTGYNSRVMNTTDFSWDNVPLPDAASGQRLWEIYTGVYGG